MESASERLEFAPPEQDPMWRGFALAILAHVLLVLGLMQGLHWQRESQDAAVEAELWARVPQEAAPREVTPPPPPPPPPVPAVKPPPPPPVVKAPPQPEPPKQRDADIALEREKQKRELEKRKQAELEHERALQQRKAEAKKREEELAKKKREEELAKKKEQAKLVAEAKHKEEEKKRKEDEKKRKELEAREAREAQKLAKLHDENLRRIQGMAGSGAPSSTGAAAQSSGPSASWGAKVQARVRPNIVFSDQYEGNPKAEVEVRTAPDGTIVGKRLVHSSGVKAWDEAVLRALEKTESLPRDIDGRVPTPVIIGFRPRD